MACGTKNATCCVKGNTFVGCESPELVCDETRRCTTTKGNFMDACSGPEGICNQKYEGLACRQNSGETTSNYWCACDPTKNDFACGPQSVCGDGSPSPATPTTGSPSSDTDQSCQEIFGDTYAGLQCGADTPGMCYNPDDPTTGYQCLSSETQLGNTYNCPSPAINKCRTSAN